MIDRAKFFDGYRYNFQKITREQLEDLEFFITKLDDSEKITGESWNIVAWKYSYVFSTVYWETAQTFDPISERGTRSYLMNKPYYPYYGRGYVQLTWKTNYRKFGDFLGIDLVNNPYLANEPENAWLILEEGMTRNWNVKRQDDPNFTAYTLEDCFNEQTINPVRARRIINGSDRASEIARICQKFYNIIDFE